MNYVKLSKLKAFGYFHFFFFQKEESKWAGIYLW